MYEESKSRLDFLDNLYAETMEEDPRYWCQVDGCHRQAQTDWPDGLPKCWQCASQLGKDN